MYLYYILYFLKSQFYSFFNNILHLIVVKHQISTKIFKEKIK